MSWVGWADEQLHEDRRLDRERTIHDFDARGPVGVLAGRAVISFASNDYLGLTAHPDVIAAAHEALDRWGAGAGAARLTVGARPIHAELEHEIAEWKAMDAALLFSSGYAANIGVLTALSRRGVTIFSDELNHASIIDGCRMAKRVVVYPHLDLDFLSDALARSEGPALVVTDAVFSMDGDAAPISELGRLCAARDALLVVDEAHCVFDPPPIPRASEVVRMGTLSKFLGSLGGFVAGPAPLIRYLTNRARSFVFSTAPTPADTAAALAALRIFRSDEGETLRRRLRTLVDLLQEGNPSPIVPYVIGRDADALAAAAHLLERGMLVPAIRPPSVPDGTARLRVALSAVHTPQQVSELAALMRDLQTVHA